MDDLLGMAIGLIVVGILAYLMGGGVLPLISIAAVIWAGACFFQGLSGGKRR